MLGGGSFSLAKMHEVSKKLASPFLDLGWCRHLWYNACIAQCMFDVNTKRAFASPVSHQSPSWESAIFTPSHYARNYEYVCCSPKQFTLMRLPLCLYYQRIFVWTENSLLAPTAFQAFFRFGSRRKHDLQYDFVKTCERRRARTRCAQGCDLRN